jgi:hypothetical protein
VTAAELRIIAELVSSDLKLSSDASEQFKYKVTSYAGVSVFQGDRFAFEHDVYFDYFLSIVLAQNLDAQKSEFLNRALLPREVSEQIAARTRNREGAINHLLSIQLDDDNSKRNAGSLSSDLLSEVGILNGATVTGVYFADVNLGGLKIFDSIFAACQFKRVDFGNTQFLNCTFEGCLGQAIIVDENTLDLRRQNSFLRMDYKASLLDRRAVSSFHPRK